VRITENEIHRTENTQHACPLLWLFPSIHHPFARSFCIGKENSQSDLERIMIEALKTFVEDVQKEMKKVSWPTREQLREATTVVIVICLIITAFVYLVDTGMTLLMQTIF
jgi:preprotein translocase subunit SecE